MAISLGFLEYTEKTRNMVSEVVKDNDARLLLTKEYQVEYQVSNLSQACQEPLS